MRGNKGVCLHAVEQDGYALEFAHESMQGKTLNATPAVVPLVLAIHVLYGCTCHGWTLHVNSVCSLTRRVHGV